MKYQILYKFYILIIVSIWSQNILIAQWQTISFNTELQNGIFFLDELNGIGINDQSISRTEDGGYTWTNLSQQMGTTWGGDDISFAPGGTGYIVKDNSSGISATDYYFTNDYGFSWENAWTTFNNFVGKIQFTSVNIGYVLATYGASPGEIYKTTNSASDWSLLYKGGSNTRFSDMKFLDDNTGLLASFTMDTIPTIFRTYNGGSTWDSITFSESLLAPLILEPVDNATVYMISGLSGKIYKSLDSCSTWTPIFNDSLLWIKQIEFPTSTVGYFSAYNLSLDKDVIYHSSDGGNTWENQTFDGFAIRDMFFLNATTGWLCGNNGNIAALGVPTKVSEYQLEKEKVFVYPNPVKQELILNFDNLKNENYSLSIYDIQGRLVRSITKITTNHLAIDKGDLTSGQYFFMLLSEGQEVVYSGKFSVQ